MRVGMSSGFSMSVKLSGIQIRGAWQLILKMVTGSVALL